MQLATNILWAARSQVFTRADVMASIAYAEARAKQLAIGNSILTRRWRDVLNHWLSGDDSRRPLGGD